MRIRLWLTKLIYLLFIVWMGGLAPLIYANPFASSHSLPRYRMAILHEPISVKAIPTPLVERVSQQLFTQRDQIAGKHIVAQLATLLHASLSTGYLLVEVTALPMLPHIAWLSREGTLLADSASLAPPKKPPRLLA